VAGAGVGSVYQRGDIWWISYTVHGRRRRESSGSRLKRDAQELLRTRIAEAAHGTPAPPSADSLTLADLAELILLDYEVNERRSIDRVELSIKHLKAFFGRKCRVLDITTLAANRYILARRAEGVANQTIKNELTALRRMFNLALDQGLLTSVPRLPRLQVNNVREGFFNAGELAALLDELTDEIRPVVQFAAFTGWRKGEVLALQWRAVDFEAGMIRLAPGTTKNREGREFPFAPFPALGQLLQDQLAVTRKIEREKDRIIPWVFHREGDRIRCFRSAWAGACDRAGLEGRWFHDLRRTAVRNLEAAGVARSVAMKLTGHKTEAVYRRYAISDRTALEEGVAKLAQLHNRARDVRQHSIPLYGSESGA
jgi:integrase